MLEFFLFFYFKLSYNPIMSIDYETCLVFPLPLNILLSLIQWMFNVFFIPQSLVGSHNLLRNIHSWKAGILFYHQFPIIVANGKVPAFKQFISLHMFSNVWTYFVWVIS